MSDSPITELPPRKKAKLKKSSEMASVNKVQCEQQPFADFSVVHGGAADCSKHLRSAKQVSLEQNRTSVSALNMLQYFSTEKNQSVIRAEVLFCTCNVTSEDAIWHL